MSRRERPSSRGRDSRCRTFCYVASPAAQLVALRMAQPDTRARAEARANDGLGLIELHDRFDVIWVGSLFTHLDAPIHFYEKGRTADQIPLEQLMGPAVVIDATAPAANDRHYRLTRDDVLAFEKANGRIAARTIVLLRTGWSRHWPDAKAYLGDDTPGDASELSFPSYGEDAARLLVEERDVSALGIDTASIDYGRSTDFVVHRVAAARNVPGLENLTNLDRLPARGTTIIALPIKIEGGSGGPVRVVALLPR